MTDTATTNDSDVRCAASRSRQNRRSPRCSPSCYHGRSWVSAPAVVARRFANRLRRRHDRPRREHDPLPRVARAGPTASPSPVTAGPNDGAAGVVARRPLPRVHVAARREGQARRRSTCMPVDGPGEVRTRRRRCPRASASRRGRPTASGSRSPAAPATPATRPRTRAGSRRARSRRSSPGSTARAGSSTGRATSTSSPSDGTGKPRNLTPGPCQHGGISWLPDSSAASSRAAARHEGWDLDLADDLYVVPLEGEIRALTEQTGVLRAARRCPPTARGSPSSAATTPTIDPQNIHVGVIAHRRWRAHAGCRPGLDRTFEPTPAPGSRCGLDDDTLLATAEDRGETHLYRVAADGSRAPQPLTQGPAVGAGVRRRRRRSCHGPGHRRAPGRDRHARRPGRRR